MRSRPLAHGEACSGELFEAIRTSVVKADIKCRHALKDAVAAYHAIGSGTTVGAAIFTDVIRPSAQARNS